MCFEKIRFSGFLWILISSPLLWSQTIVIEPHDTDFIEQNPFIQMAIGNGPVTFQVVTEGNTDPNDPETVGFVEEVMVGTMRVTFIVEEGDDIDPNDPEGLLGSNMLLPEFIVEEGDDIDPNDPEGLLRSHMTLLEYIVEEGDDIDPNDPEGLSAKAETGTILHRWGMANLEINIVIRPTTQDTNLLIRVFHTRF